MARVARIMRYDREDAKMAQARRETPCESVFAIGTPTRDSKRTEPGAGSEQFALSGSFAFLHRLMSSGKTRAMPGQADHGEDLRRASRINDVERVKELLEKGAEVNASYVSALKLLRQSSSY